MEDPREDVPYYPREPSYFWVWLTGICLGLVSIATLMWGMKPC